MITVDLTQFFAIALVGVALLAGISAGWDRLHDWKSARSIRRGTVRCRICGANSRKEGHQAVQVCPECGSPNSTGRDRRLG